MPRRRPVGLVARSTPVIAGVVAVRLPAAAPACRGRIRRGHALCRKPHLLRVCAARHGLRGAEPSLADQRTWWTQRRVGGLRRTCLHGRCEGMEPYAPPIVTDWEALDADIESFIGTFSKASSTLRCSEVAWNWWVRHCGAHDTSPWSAPWSVWQDIFQAESRNGSTYDARHPRRVLAEVRRRYAEASLRSPAPDEAAHLAEWKTLCLGHAHEKAAERAAACRCEGDCQCGTAPLSRSDVHAMNAVPLSRARYRESGAYKGEMREAAFVAVLAGLDTGLSATALARVAMDEVIVLDGGDVDLAGHLLPCDHLPRAGRVVWDCAACAVRGLREKRTRDGASKADAFFAVSESMLGQRFHKLRREWARVLGVQISSGVPANVLVLRDDLDDWIRAGARRGLVIATWHYPEGSWLMGRAWVTVAWCGGYRMCGDLAALPRAAVTLLPDGGGVAVALDQTKSHPDGEQCLRPLLYEDCDDASVSAASLLTEYLAVRDALVGSAGCLFISAPRGRLRGAAEPMSSPGATANRILRELAGWGGLAPVFTSYSTRRGFVAQAELDGWSLERTQAGLRHALPETTFRFYRRHQAKRAVTKLAGYVDAERTSDER
jgi:hypothetical protein